MQSLTGVMSLLREVRSLRFDARSEAETGWDGVGTGVVAVSEPSADVVVLDEAGVWQPGEPGGAGLRFRNTFRWSIVDDVLRLEHLRSGPGRPVFLFDLSLGADGVWRQASPHVCREDCYTASLEIRDAQLMVSWSIVGPRKRESIRYKYW